MVIDPSDGSERHPGPAIAGILALWFTAVLGLGLTVIFESGPSRPPLPVLAAVVIPLKLFALGHRAAPVVPAFVLDIDLRLLTAM